MWTALIDVLMDTRRYWWGLHILGVVFGLGGATVTDVMFFRFMRNYRVDESEAAIMKILSIVVWVGLGVLIVSGLAMFLPRWELFVGSDRFLMKMTVVAVVLINGLALNLWLQPRARRISFVEPGSPLTEGEVRERVRVRRMAFALGSISVVGWYGAFALAVLNMVAMPYSHFLLLFVLAVGVALVGGQFHERHFEEKVEEKHGEMTLSAEATPAQLELPITSP